MEAEDAVLAVSPEKAVVDVDIGIARLLQAVRRHRAGGFEDDRFGDVDAEGVPARPAHERTELRIARGRNLRRVQQPSRARGDLVAVHALQMAQVYIRFPSGEVDADALVALRAFPELDTGIRGVCGCRHHGGEKHQVRQLHFMQILLWLKTPELYHIYGSCRSANGNSMRESFTSTDF